MGAPLVFIHGDFGDGRDAWEDVVALIGPMRRTLVVNRPGNADLASDEARHSFASDAAAALREIDELGAPRIHLVGHSYGGLVALAIALTRPQVVRSLHLIEPPMFDLVPKHDSAQAMNREARRIQADHAQVGDERSTEDFFAMIGAGRAGERLRTTPEWDRFVAYAGRFARSEPAGDFPATALDRLPDNVVVAVYTGGRSHPVLRDIGVQLAARIPQAHLVEVAEAHHAVQKTGQPFVSRLLEIVDAADAAASERPLPVANTGRE